MNKTLQLVYQTIYNGNTGLNHLVPVEAILLTQSEYNTLLEENTYLKAEFEANKDKVYTQEEMDKAKQKSFDKGYKNGWAEAVNYKL